MHLTTGENVILRSGHRHGHQFPMDRGKGRKTEKNENQGKGGRTSKHGIILPQNQRTGLKKRKGQTSLG